MKFMMWTWTIVQGGRGLSGVHKEDEDDVNKEVDEDDVNKEEEDDVNKEEDDETGMEKSSAGVAAPWRRACA